MVTCPLLEGVYWPTCYHHTLFVLWFYGVQMTQETQERRHGYPRLLAPHVMHNRNDDHVKSAHSISQQLYLAVARISAAHQASITYKQGCWRNEGSMDRDVDRGRGLGLDLFFFPVSSRSSNSTRYFKFRKNSNSISPSSFPKIISITRSSSRTIQPPPTP
jgi:hypothetical protein